MDQLILGRTRRFWKQCLLLCGMLLAIGVGSLFLMSEVALKQNAVPVRVMIGATPYSLEIADTDEERAKGLGTRESLCETCGMLFLFDTPGRYAFWMKDMRFPIDIIWLLDDRVVFIERAVPPDALTVFNPDVLANRVLEIGSGAGKGFRAGDRVKFTYE